MKRKRDLRHEWFVTTETGFRSFVKPDWDVINAGKGGQFIRAYIHGGAWQLAPLICNAPSLARIRVEHLEKVLAGETSC